MQEHNQLHTKETFHRNMPKWLWNKAWGTSGSSALSSLGGEVEAADMNKYQHTRGNKEACGKLQFWGRRKTKES